ncbi:hypothetical protein, partial [Bifidobacterium longum]|uniref:hypothetical protein n=1 Tax=Bifidobacterium longum TaxID=216816 RepID=UPI0011780FB3
MSPPDAVKHTHIHAIDLAVSNKTELAIAAAVWSLIAAIGVTATLTVGVAATHQTITLSPPEAYS